MDSVSEIDIEENTITDLKEEARGHLLVRVIGIDMSCKFIQES